MEISEQAQYLIPAAVSLAYGELFATAITLVLVPLLVRITSDFFKPIRSDGQFKVKYEICSGINNINNSRSVVIMGAGYIYSTNKL